MRTVLNIIVSVLLWSLLATSIVRWRRQPHEMLPSRLRIHNADYRAINGQGDAYDVTQCLQKMIHRDTLLLKIENDSFSIDGHNYVPKDPFFGVMKRLDVTYSFDGVTGRAIRPEGTRMVLPEDTFIQSAVAEIPQIPFSPFQLQTFLLAKELRQFIVQQRSTKPQLPSDGERTVQNAVLHAMTQVQPWRERVKASFELQFRQRLDALILNYQAVGKSVPELSNFRSTGLGVDPEKDIQQLAISLVEAAHGLDEWS